MKKVAAKYLQVALWAGVLIFIGTHGAFATTGDLSDVSRNITTSASRLPGLIAALSYLLAVIFGISAIIKIREHVENPNQTPLREPLIRLLAAGALVALPIIYEAMRTTIGAGAGVNPFSTSIMSVLGTVSGAMGAVGSWNVMQDFNTILGSIVESVEDVPALIAGIGYLLGLVLGVTGILKLKEHIESPQQIGLREGMIRLLIGGSLISLPMIYEAMNTTVAGTGGGGFLGALAGIIGGGGVLLPTTAIDVQNPGNINNYGCVGGLAGGVGGALSGLGGVLSGIPGLGGLGGAIGGLGAAIGGPTLGTAVCNAVMHSMALPAFLQSMSYLFGLVLGVWGLLKIKDHVLEPRQTPVWEGVTRILAGGAFFALPAVMTAAFNTVGELLLPHFTTGFSGTASAGGLDSVMVQFMGNLMGPVNVAINFFGFVAGMVFVMIGISRLMKSAQEGPRGPGGVGTIATFMIGGALMAFSPMIAAASNSLFQTVTPGITETSAALQYTAGMNPAEVDHAHAVISAMLKFMIVLGLISFMRGLFIIRGVAEGNSQSSMMAGVTHIIGGALAVNLGPLVNAVQTTLGLTGVGVVFS